MHAPTCCSNKPCFRKVGFGASWPKKICLANCLANRSSGSASAANEQRSHCLLQTPLFLATQCIYTGQVGAMIRDHESRDEGKEKVQVETKAICIDKLVPSKGNFTPNTRIDRNKGLRWTSPEKIAVWIPWRFVIGQMKWNPRRLSAYFLAHKLLACFCLWGGCSGSAGLACCWNTSGATVWQALCQANVMFLLCRQRGRRPSLRVLVWRRLWRLRWWGSAPPLQNLLCRQAPVSYVPVTASVQARFGRQSSPI